MIRFVSRFARAWYVLLWIIINQDQNGRSQFYTKEIIIMCIALVLRFLPCKAKDKILGTTIFKVFVDNISNTCMAEIVRFVY